MKLRFFASAAALCVALVTPLAGAAQSRPAREHILSRGVPDGARASPPATRVPGNDHVLYGRIDALRGAILTVRTRSGGLQRVDASAALRSGAYSEPLFVGKIVRIHGSYDTSRTLQAQSVMRTGQLDAATGPDR